MWVWSLVWKIPWSRKWQPAPVFLPRKFHGERSQVGYYRVTKSLIWLSAHMHYWLTITEDKDLVSLQHLTQTCSSPFTITRAPLPWQHVTQSQVHPGQPKPLGKGKVLLSCPCDNLLQGESEECHQGQTLHVPFSFLYLTFLIVTNSKFIGEVQSVAESSVQSLSRV